MYFSISWLLASLTLTPVTAGYVLPPRSTVTTSSSPTNIPSPTTTCAPSPAALQKRFNTICGFISGNPLLPATCAPGSHCAIDSSLGAIGCCPDTGPCTTGIFTGCIDRNSAAPASSDPFIFTCATDSLCYRNNFQGGFSQFGCASATDVAASVMMSVTGVPALDIQSVTVAGVVAEAKVTGAAEGDGGDGGDGGGGGVSADAVASPAPVEATSAAPASNAAASPAATSAAAVSGVASSAQQAEASSAAAPAAAGASSSAAANSAAGVSSAASNAAAGQTSAASSAKTSAAATSTSNASKTAATDKAAAVTSTGSTTSPGASSAAASASSSSASAAPASSLGAFSEDNNKKKNSPDMGAVIGGTMSGVAVFLILVSVGFYYIRKKKKAHREGVQGKKEFEKNGPMKDAGKFVPLASPLPSDYRAQPTTSPSLAYIPQPSPSIPSPTAVGTALTTNQPTTQNHMSVASSTYSRYLQPGALPSPTGFTGYGRDSSYAGVGTGTGTGLGAVYSAEDYRNSYAAALGDIREETSSNYSSNSGSSVPPVPAIPQRPGSNWL